MLFMTTSSMLLLGSFMLILEIKVSELEWRNIFIIRVSIYFLDGKFLEQNEKFPEKLQGDLVMLSHGDSFRKLSKASSDGDHF